MYLYFLDTPRTYVGHVGPLFFSNALAVLSLRILTVNQQIILLMKYILPNKITSINNNTNHDIIFLFADTYPTHSGESFCSSDISLDDSTNFEQLDEGGSDTLSLQNLDMQAPHPPPPSESLLPNMVQVNPIDKLYLMQNSYFSTEQ